MNQTVLDIVTVAQILLRVRDRWPATGDPQQPVYIEQAVLDAAGLVGGTDAEINAALEETSRRATAKPITLGELQDALLPSRKPK